MKRLSLTFCLFFAAVSAACVQAGDCVPGRSGCGASKACDVCEQPPGCCRPVAKCEPVEKTCYEIECKTICIPAITFPWQNGPLAGLFGGRCGAACQPNGACGDGFCSDLCGEVRAVKTLKKSSKKIGEKLVCEWKHDPTCCHGANGYCGARKPGCCNDLSAPPASAPAPPADQPDVVPAPPEVPAETASSPFPAFR